VVVIAIVANLFVVVVAIIIDIPWSPLLLMFHGCHCCSIVVVAIVTTISWS
jgi:hypothetical protein